MKNTVPKDENIRFDLPSRDGTARHRLSVMYSENKFKINCTCVVSQRGLLCQHKFGLASGDGAIFAAEHERLPDLLNFISQSPLPTAIEELKRLEKERNILVDDIRMQRLFILALMSG